ncbi:3-deoxy-7-phosphoheptulonate synthase [Nitrospira defluvii]|nr:3-deoxy-7-phosphoheptulonate synthase [Nitrospira defluvii]
MIEDPLNNLNVVSRALLPTPAEVKGDFPVTDKAAKIILRGRTTVQNILRRKDPRVFIVVGPCSIHDLKAGLEYAGRLKALADEVAESLVLIMRVYFEKPRTTIGWKGLINDPDMDDSFQMEKGLRMARGFLLRLAELGLPTGTEALDPITPQYLSDLTTWTAIGARTTESQTHREMSSGLSTPVGFKNGTDGGLQVAINALCSVSRSHHFLGINQLGQCAVFHTRGNRYGHIVLRGGGGHSNYDAKSITLCETALEQAGLATNIVVDCSHGNSLKDPTQQPKVLENCIDQALNGNRSIVGFMLESNLESGNQKVPSDLSALRYGVSVTDACIDWSTTERILRETHLRLKDTLGHRNP